MLNGMLKIRCWSEMLKRHVEIASWNGMLKMRCWKWHVEMACWNECWKRCIVTWICHMNIEMTSWHGMSKCYVENEMLKFMVEKTNERHKGYKNAKSFSPSEAMEKKYTPRFVQLQFQLFLCFTLGKIIHLKHYTCKKLRSWNKKTIQLKHKKYTSKTHKIYNKNKQN